MSKTVLVVVGGVVVVVLAGGVYFATRKKRDATAEAAAPPPGKKKKKKKSKAADFLKDIGQNVGREFLSSAGDQIKHDLSLGTKKASQGLFGGISDGIGGLFGGQKASPRSSGPAAQADYLEGTGVGRSLFDASLFN